MNYRMIGYLLSIILLIEAGLLLLPLAVAAIYGESIIPFVITMLLLLAVSLPSVLFKPKDRRIYAKEGFVVVAGGWVLMSVFGCLPFMFSGSITSFIDAFFETVSGFTTTGSSILTEVEGNPMGILFWRSLTHWVGGMGVLVFMMAILPSSSGGQNIHLMRAEVPGPTKGKLVPKMRQTALILYGIYFFLTIAMVISLLLCDMPLYDSLVNSFATAGTGGFSVLNESIGGYNNPAAEWVIAIFMFVFGVNFNLYYLVLIGRAREMFKSEEFRAYTLLCLASTAAIAVNTLEMYKNAEGVGTCIRDAFFQVTTIMSTSGFGTTNFDLWPTFSKTLLVLLMIVGACAGSTAGGLKVSRVLMVLKGSVCRIRQILRPRSVNVVRMDGEVIPDDTVRSATSYISMYFSIVVITTLLLSIDGFDIETNLTATLACINNIGPGLGGVGPASNFSGYSDFSTLLLTFNMLLGRLEIMPMLILFSPFAWKKR